MTEQDSPIDHLESKEDTLLRPDGVLGVKRKSLCTYMLASGFRLSSIGVFCFGLCFDFGS